MSDSHVNQIIDMNRYNSEMVKSLVDKMSFIDKVEANIFIDFGCADGILLGFMKKMFPDFIYIGYDIEKRMIDEAVSKPENKGIHFYSSWDDVIQHVKELKKDENNKTCLIVNSVIHELHSYLSPNELKDVMDQIFDYKNEHRLFNFIAIRDMMVSKTTSRLSDSISVARIKQIFNNRLLDDWESTWGTLSENWSLVHFLLTYRYVHSWERESKENYLPINVEDFLKTIPSHYFPVLMEHYTLPFIRRCVKKDFGIDLSDKTHLKLILELI